MKAFWLSFGDPQTGENLGAAVVEGDNFMSAVKNAQFMGCNPGGEVIGYEVKPDTKGTIPRHLWWKLRNAEEWAAAGVKIGNIDQKDRANLRCEACERGLDKPPHGHTDLHNPHGGH